MRHFSPSVEMEVPGTMLRGPDQVAGFFGALWEAFPDFQVTMPTQVEQGPFVAVQFRVTGTHLGTLRTPGGDIPPTGRHINLPCSDFFEVQGGLIVSVKLHFDRLTLLEQLGVAPVPAHA